ncbi:cell wall-associated NlpC family hydrolase [Stackebrandtia endophytica]|uniref:Cell wall-associated NlpC family hydrolase n=1 Tax=Stackebrandtia endophytica TaxID=1496996 RepID=A0A543AWE5_9ACTN|nr:C40 family peptidase [Stackebrandtia endophytica]TQL76908.1 cell wall-associated NlpC family hydrolase [Stackebrandtia endophytica]
MATQSRRPATHHLLLAMFSGCVIAAAPTVAIAEPTIETLENQLADSTAELDVIVEDYNQVNEALFEANQRYTDLTVSSDWLQDHADVAAAELGDMATALYRGGRHLVRFPGVVPILTGTPDTLADRLGILEYLSLDRQRWSTQLSDANDDLATELLLLNDLTEQLDALETAKSDKETEITEAVRQLERAQTTAYGSGYGSGPNLAAPPIPGGSADAASAAVQFAHNALGAPYEWGGSGPGYDCSGLTSAAWASAGVYLPHSSQGQYDSAARVDRDQLRPGDLVFYYGDIRHVAMYVGEGKIIHSPTAGQTVQVAPMDQMPIQGYGRPG